MIPKFFGFYSHSSAGKCVVLEDCRGPLKDLCRLWTPEEKWVHVIDKNLDVDTGRDRCEALNKCLTLHKHGKIHHDLIIMAHIL